MSLSYPFKRSTISKSKKRSVPAASGTSILEETVGVSYDYFYDMFDGPGAEYRTPSNLRTGLSSSTYTTGGFLVEQQYPVTGTSGSLTLTCSNSGLVAGMGSAPWAGAILLADGVTAIEVLILSNDGTSILNLAYPLPKEVLNGSILTSLYDAAFGQHRTRIGTIAWIQKFLNRESFVTKRIGNIVGGINRQTDPNPIGPPKWSKNSVLNAWAGGTVNGISGFSDTDNALNIVSGGTITRPIRPASHACGSYGGMPSVGCGLITNGSLPKGTGFIELYPSIIPGTIEDVNSQGEVNVWFTDNNGVERLAFSKTFNRVLTKIQSTFLDNDVSYRIEVKRIDNGLAWSLRVLEFRIFSSKRIGSNIPSGAKIVFMGDSWGAWYDGVAATELKRLIPVSRVSNRSVPGMTMNWVLAWLEYYISSEGATDIIINQSINDLNSQVSSFLKPDGSSAPLSMGSTATEREENWINAIKQAVKICKDRNVRLHVIMPSGTASQSQAQNLANAASNLYVMKY